MKAPGAKSYSCFTLGSFIGPSSVYCALHSPIVSLLQRTLKAMNLQPAEDVHRVRSQRSFCPPGVWDPAQRHMEALFPQLRHSLNLILLVLTKASSHRLLLLLSHFSRVRLLATPWTAAYQAPESMGFSRQEYWSGVPSPSPS